MRPTRLRDLAVTAIVSGVVSWLLIRRFYGALPPLPYSGAVTELLLSTVALFLAPSIRARLAGRPRTKPIMPIAVARAAAFAKASSLLGALSVGCWAGALAHLLGRIEARKVRDDATVAAVSAAVAVLLVVAALRLERACRVPRVPPAPDDPAPAWRRPTVRSARSLPELAASRAQPQRWLAGAAGARRRARVGATCRRRRRRRTSTP